MTQNIDVSELNSAQGFVVNGANPGDEIGWSVSNAGDINGDGITDIIIGAPEEGTGGSSYIIFGTTTGFSNINLSTLTTNQGFAIYSSTAYEQNGYSVSKIGDINGDGYDDIIIGAYGAQDNTAGYGIGYVIFGKASGFNAIDVDTMTTNQGFSIINSNNLGHSVSGAGDFNKDGYDDFIISAVSTKTGGNGLGTTYLLFGHSGSFSNIDLSKALTSNQGFMITGDPNYYYSGYSVSGAGDVNGDGYDDIVIGAPGSIYSNPVSTGRSYVIFGGTNTLTISLANLNANQGFSITGAKAGNRIGISISAAGDVNGDGYDDVIIGAPYVQTSSYSSQTGSLSYANAGTSYVVFGNTTKHLNNINLATTPQSSWFYISSYTAYSYSGYSVSGAGDVNGDGYDDLVVGAPSSFGYIGIGTSYVIFGGISYENINLNTLTSSQGFYVTQSYTSNTGSCGYSVSLADMNNDGLADVIIGAPGMTNSHGAGQTFVIFGSISPTQSPTYFPTLAPTIKPTLSPTLSPTAPTLFPTAAPSGPTLMPSKSPTSIPTSIPTSHPSADTKNPTIKPSFSPTSTSDTNSEGSTKHTTSYTKSLIISLSIGIPVTIITTTLGFVYKEYLLEKFCKPNGNNGRLVELGRNNFFSNEVNKIPEHIYDSFLFTRSKLLFNNISNSTLSTLAQHTYSEGINTIELYTELLASDKFISSLLSYATEFFFNKNNVIIVFAENISSCYIKKDNTLMVSSNVDAGLINSKVIFMHETIHAMFNELTKHTPQITLEAAYNDTIHSLLKHALELIEIGGRGDEASTMKVFNKEVAISTFDLSTEKAYFLERITDYVNGIDKGIYPGGAEGCEEIAARCIEFRVAGVSDEILDLCKPIEDLLIQGMNNSNIDNELI